MTSISPTKDKPVWLWYYQQSQDLKGSGFEDRLVQLGKDDTGAFIDHEASEDEMEAVLDALKKGRLIDIRRLIENPTRGRYEVDDTPVDMSKGLNLRDMVVKREYQDALGKMDDAQIMREVIEGPKLRVAGRMVNVDLTRPYME